MRLTLVGGFLFVSLFVPFFTSLPLISLFTYFFLSFFFIRSFFLSVFLFTFFSIFLVPAPKLFRVTWVNKLHLHFSFHTVKFGVPVLRGVPGCSGVFRGVPVFLVLVHAYSRCT